MNHHSHSVHPQYVILYSKERNTKLFFIIIVFLRKKNNQIECKCSNALKSIEYDFFVIYLIKVLGFKMVKEKLFVFILLSSVIQNVQIALHTQYSINKAEVSNRFPTQSKLNLKHFAIHSSQTFALFHCELMVVV